MDHRNSVIFLDLREFTAVSRSILDFKLLEEHMRRPPPKVLMDLVRDVPNIML
jgi:hypothetical protein